MKKLLLVTLILGMTRSNALCNTIYRLDQGTLLQPCDDKGNANGQMLPVQQNWLFYVDYHVGTNYVIHFLKFKHGNNITHKVVKETQDKIKRLIFFEKEITRQEIEPVYFLIPDATFNDKNMVTAVSVPGFSAGVVTLPIKIRPNFPQKSNRPFDFGSDFNLGLSGAFKLRSWYKSQTYLYALGGINITSIKVDSFDTKGFVKTPTNASALAYFGGVLISAKDVQFILSVGADNLSRDLGKNWIYQQRPWIGIGLGYSIFKASGSPGKQ